MKALPLALITLVACGNDSVPPSDDPPVTEPVYYGQVQRIINDNCVECHSTDPDRLAPFSLATFEDVKAAADADMPIAYDVMNRVMPPFYANQDGDCHTFPNAKWLSPEDMDTLVTWVNGSRLAGDPANSSATPAPELPVLDRRDHVVDIGVSYTPIATAEDDFRCFVVDAIGADKFVTGVHVKPTNLTVAHHVILFTLDTQQAEDEAVAQQLAAGGPYRCDGGPTALGSTFLAGWVPGQQATVFPPSTGIAVDGTRKMVVQMHYNLAHSDGQPDRTTIELQLEDNVATPAQMIRISGDVDLPPRDPDATATGSVTIPANAPNLKLWGGGLHMHQRGTGARLAANDQCLMDLVNWSFHWQHFYWYAQPVELRGGDKVSLTCHYDTSNDTTRVGFCEGTECEMCIQFGYVTAE
jgi:hypothetical protein